MGEVWGQAGSPGWRAEHRLQGSKEGSLGAGSEKERNEWHARSRS